MVQFIIKKLRKLAFARHIKSISNYVIKGNSYFFENFRLIIIKPVQNKKYLKVGEDSILDCKVLFESDTGEVVIGNRVYIGPSNIICKNKIEFGDDVHIAGGSYFYDHNSHSIDYRERQNDITQQLSDYRSGKFFIENKNWTVVENRPIKICSNAWVGMNCTILKGVTIGEGAIVAAASVITKDVPAWTVFGGNPARLLKEIPIELRGK